MAGLGMNFKSIGLIFLILIALDDFVPLIGLSLIPHDVVAAPEPRSEPLQGMDKPSRTPWSEVRRGSVFVMTPRAAYDISARVADRDHYRWSAVDALMPWDLVLTWGRLVDEPYRSKISYVHTRRFYNWGTDDGSLDMNYVNGHSANVHLAAANGRVASALTRVRAGDVVRLEGDLIDITGPDAFNWKTSMTRTDTGSGACETMYVRAVTIGTSRYH